MGKKQLFDADGLPSGNSWTSAAIAEEESLWDLADQDDGCPLCGYDGQLRSTRKGYKCPECREIVIPSE